MSTSGIAAMESLDMGLRPVATSTHEYYLQGSILDSKAELLMHRLQALCDYGRPPETFRDHEIVFCMPRHLPPEMQMTLRVRKSLERKNTKLHLRYLGIPEIGYRPTSVRTCINFMVNELAVEFLSTLGFEMDYDFIAKGYIFSKGIMKITMTKVYKTSNKFTDEVLWCGGTQTPLGHSFLVEMSVLACSGMSSTIGQNMRQFAEQLMPLVRMEKMDDKATYSRA